MATLSRRFHVEEGSLGTYLRDISKHAPVPAHEEAQLAVRIRNNDKQALERLVNANLRFVVSVARNYQNQGMALADMISEGNLGLIRAAKRFDEKKGFKFISYAVWWIRQSILAALATQSRIAKVPLNQIGIIHRVGKARCRLEQKLHRLPNMQELAEELGIPVADVYYAHKIGNAHTSLDAPVTRDGDTRLVDTIADSGEEAPGATTTENPLGASVDESLAVLSQRERLVLKMYYGVGEETAYTLEEIGARVKITRERVRQIKARALEKLKRFRTHERLGKCVAVAQ